MRSVLPEVRLSDEAFLTRHRALRLVLWLQLPLLALVAVLSDEPHAVAHRVPGMDHAAGNPLVWVMAVVLAGCAAASTMIKRRRLGAATVSLGLLLSAALLVSLGGGRTDLHLGYFLVLGLISLYQDWLPLVMSVLLVAMEHLVMGVLWPGLLYSDPRAHAQPVGYALLHAAFVLGMCAIQIVFWRFAQRAQQETDRVRAEGEQALRRTAERFEALVQDSSDVTLVVRPDGRISSASAAAERVMGYRPADLAGFPHRELIHPDDRADLRPDLRAEIRIRHADGSWHWHDLTARDLTGNPAVAGVVVNHRDVSERRAIQERLRYEACHDTLTGLCNRAELLRTLDRELAAGTDDVAVLYLDLDGFKQVNDTHGHVTGDELLVAVAAGLQRSLLGADTAGRLGGDEFAVVLTNVSQPDDAITVAKRILGELARPVAVNGTVLQPRASIGIALAEPGERQTDRLMHRADIAMYHAKRAGTSGWQMYLDGMHEPDSGAAALEDDLRRAVDAGELRLHYQPVADLRTGELTGFEALVRWQHPARGLLLPEEFIPLAEQSELILRIGRWVLTTACRQLRQWQDGLAAGPALRLSVNMSRRELESASVVSDVLGVLAETGLAPTDLVLEIAETAVVDAEPVVSRMSALRDHGVLFALDDFGAGYSSLRHLTRPPVDVLKLDECFVAALDGTPNGWAVQPGQGTTGAGNPKGDTRRPDNVRSPTLPVPSGGERTSMSNAPAAGRGGASGGVVMPAQLPVGPYRMVRTADNRMVPWYVIPFDEHGTCTGPRTRDELVQRAGTGGFTDIVMFCHGWNNDWGQATRRYDDFFNGFVRMRTERALPVPDGFNPLLVGIFWPSKLMVDAADQGPDIAGDEGADQLDDQLVGDERQAVDDLARQIGPDRAPRFFELAQQDTLSEAEAQELAGILAPLYATDRDETADEDAPAPADIVDSWVAPRRRPPVADPADFGVATPEPAAGDPLAAGFLDFLKPQEIVRSASVWLMKDRAGRVGARGVGPLLAALVGSGARVHVVGHSYGAKVMLSAIVAPASLPGRVHSTLLLQPAVSHLCFAADANGKGGRGGYRPALDRVTRPILTTFSAHDLPLTKIFHLALRRAGDLGDAQIAGDEPPNRYAALGGFGPRPLGADTELVSVLDPTTPYPLGPDATRVIGVNGTRTISAHGDVSNPSTWWMLYNLMTR